MNHPRRLDGPEASIADLQGEILRLQGQNEGLLQAIAALQQSAITTQQTALPTIALYPDQIAGLLTLKQNAALQLIHAGKKNREIAVILEIAESTAKVHVRSIMVKLEKSTRQQVVITTRPLFDLAPEAYEKLTGLPSNWHENPEAFPLITKRLRTRMKEESS